jgi:hypothetical protein
MYDEPAFLSNDDPEVICSCPGLRDLYKLLKGRKSVETLLQFFSQTKCFEELEAIWEAQLKVGISTVHQHYYILLAQAFRNDDSSAQVNSKCRLYGSEQCSPMLNIGQE